MPTESRPEDRPARRVTVVAGGPVLIEGPVEITTPEGEVVTSDRFVVAVCACRRSKRFPLCDTSHRKRARPAKSEGRPSNGGPITQ